MRRKRSRRADGSKLQASGKTIKLSDQVIYGGHAVIAALQNPEREIIKLTTTENAARRFSDVLKIHSAKLIIAKGGDLDRLVGADAVHQGLVLETRPLPEPSLDQIIASTQPLDRVLFVILDQITDPHNVGAIMRSCAAFSVSAVVVPARNSVEHSAVLAKAASGAIEHVPLVRVTNLVRALKALKDAHVSVIGFDSELSDNFETVCNYQRIALVFGAEGRGMRRLTRENCDHLVRLQTPGAIKSLNVSNACAIALYACTVK